MIGLDSMSLGDWDGMGLDWSEDQNQGGESASAYV